LKVTPQHIVAGDKVEVCVEPEHPQRAEIGAERDSGIPRLEAMEGVARDAHALGEEHARQIASQARASEALSQRFHLSRSLGERFSDPAAHVR
jgi:hypothetical protein